jgi:hypothetical protein
MDPQTEKDEAPLKGYLAGAALPAGLLLALGSRYVLKRASTSEVYQREAPETLSALQWLQGAGLAMAALSLLVMLWSLRRLFWRKRG